MEALLLIIGLMAGAITTWLVMRNHQNTLLQQQNDACNQRIEDLRAASNQQLQQMEDNHQQQLQQMEVSHKQQLNQIEVSHKQQVEQMEASHKQQLEQMENNCNQRIEAEREQTQQQMALIKEQMNTASERILKERAEQLATTNKEQLANILNPLQTNIQQMREAVEKTGQQSSTTMERLDATIKQSIAQSREVGERADKLAQALTGENKTQGNFGELRLKQMLEEMGLVEGTQFEEQHAMRDADGNIIRDDENGRRLIPDVILHFPDERDVIIDSKMSFTAFERYHNAQSDDEKVIALQQHIASMRSHVNELASKNYSKYIKDGRTKLDFVLMYVFSESALQLALSNDTTLWKEAYDRGVIITGSQNLYVMLRVLEISWKHIYQIENQQNIIDCANNIIDRVQLFAERFEAVRQQLTRTQNAFEDVERITADSGMSIVTPARQLIKMGGRENPKRKKSIAQAAIEG